MSNHTPQISDWPEGYVAELLEVDLYGAMEEEILDALVSEHMGMRFGRHIDLNIQQGFYLHFGDGDLSKAEGSDSGFVVGALGSPSVTVDATGRASWWASEAEPHYVEDGPEKLTWVLANARGPWMLTADYHEGKWDGWYWLVLRFLSDADEAAFLVAFPGAGA